MVRAVKWVQELRLMLDCVLNSVLHLIWCITLIMLVLVCFALLLIQGMTSYLSDFDYNNPAGKLEMAVAVQSIDGVFDSVPNAMLTLFQATTGGTDWKEPYDLWEPVGPLHSWVFLFYIAFFAIVAWNIV